MAQLNNTIVNGILRASTIATSILKDASGSAGTNGQILTNDNGTIKWKDATTLSLYWANILTTSSAQYDKVPTVKNIKLNSQTTGATAPTYTTTLQAGTSSANVTLTMPSSSGTLALNTIFGGATASATGTRGLVPAPNSGYQHYLLRGDATWVKLNILDGGAAATTAWGTFE